MMGERRQKYKKKGCKQKRTSEKGGLFWGGGAVLQY